MDSIKKDAMAWLDNISSPHAHNQQMLLTLRESLKDESYRLAFESALLTLSSDNYVLEKMHRSLEDAALKLSASQRLHWPKQAKMAINRSFNPQTQSTQ